MPRELKEMICDSASENEGNLTNSGKVNILVADREEYASYMHSYGKYFHQAVL